MILPAGPLRELPSSLSNYEITIFNKSKKSELPGFRYELSEMVSLEDETILPLSNVYGSTIHLVTAIANPYLLISDLQKIRYKCNSSYISRSSVFYG